MSGIKVRYGRYAVVLIGMLAMTGGDRVAWAQTAADKAAADALFHDGKKRIRSGDTAGACEKFEVSLASFTQLGAQIALASCYEELGKTASAWGAFRAAVSLASRLRDKRQRFCEQHAAALEGKLSKLAITVTAAHRVAGLAVKRDGAVVAPAELGSAVPVDPGEHTVEASAAGHVAWSTRVTVPSTPDVVEVAVPALREVPVVVPVKRRSRTLAYSLGGTGIAVLATSLVFGAVARSKWNDSRPHCDGRLCDPTGLDLAGSAHTYGNLSTGLFVVGAGALAAAALLVLAEPRAKLERAPTRATSLRIVPRIGPTHVGLAILGGL